MAALPQCRAAMMFSPAIATASADMLADTLPPDPVTDKEQIELHEAYRGFFSLCEAVVSCSVT